MILLICFLGALARVWYGADDLPKLLQNRGLQTAFMMILFMICFADKDFGWFGWCMAIAATCWMQFQFWSRGHGICIDVGDSTNVSENDIKRYNDRWYHKVCDKLLPNHKYGYLYDFIYLTLRYGCPMLVLSLATFILSLFGICEPKWGYILIGLSIAPIYVFCNELAEREPWVFEKKTWYWRRGWSLAEILSGAVTYGACYLLRL